MRIAIMPFEPPAGRDGMEAWRPIAEWILADLAEMAGDTARIVGPSSTSAYDGSATGLRQLANDYDVHFILNGRFIETDESPRLLAELIRVADGAHVWVRTFGGPGGERRIGREISRGVARALKLGDAPVGASS